MSAPGVLVANSVGPRRRRRRLRLGRAEPLVWIAPAFAVVDAAGCAEATPVGSITTGRAIKTAAPTPIASVFRLSAI